MKSAPTIAFDYRASPALRIGQALLALLALLGLLLTDLPTLPGAAIAIAVIGLAVYSDRSLRRPRWTRLAWQGEGGWRVSAAGGDQLAAELLEARVLGVMIVLRFLVAENARCNVVLLPDNADADTRRLLRVRLRREHGQEQPPIV